MWRVESVEGVEGRERIEGTKGVEEWGGKELLYLQV